MWLLKPKPILPLIFVNSNINQHTAGQILNKLKKINYSKVKVIGMVVDVQNNMPVQMQKICQFIKAMRDRHNIKVYGFTHTRVTPCKICANQESYYLLSAADQVYTHPTTVFELQKGAATIKAQKCLQNLGIHKTTVKSSPEVMGTFMDKMTISESSKYFNQKESDMTQRLYRESITQRKSLKNNITFDNALPSLMLGSQALQKGYADKIGTYYQTLSQKYPEYNIQRVKFSKTVSPQMVIIILFLFKVFVKYSIIMYLWLLHSKKSNQKTK